MTSQIPDSIQFDGKTFSIAAVHGNELFNPHLIGLHPLPTVTSCWRGYVCKYAVSDNQLQLDELALSLDKSDPTQVIRINGRQPSPPVNQYTFLNTHFNQIGLIMPFSGGLLAADEFIQELYVHMGFQPAWKYKVIFELTFKNGILLDKKDVSIPIELIRNKILSSDSIEERHAAKLGLKMDYGF